MKKVSEVNQLEEDSEMLIIAEHKSMSNLLSSMKEP